MVMSNPLDPNYVYGAGASSGLLKADGSALISPSPVISDPIRWVDTPGSFNSGTPARPGRQGVIRADLTKQYVADSHQQWFINWVRSLSFAVDDVTADFGDDLYERMMFDADVTAQVNIFKTGVLENGLTLSPAVKNKDEDGYDQAVLIRGQCERMLDELGGFGIEAYLWNMLDAAPFGNKISEINWRLDTTYTGNQMYVVDTIRVKPRRSSAFVVNVYMDIIGILGLVPGIGFPVQTGTMIQDPDKQPNLMPTDKFAWLSFRPRDENPLGTSLCRPAYYPWNLKMQIYGEWMKWLSQFATPSVIGITPPDAQEQPMRDSLGNVILGTDNKPIMLSPEQQMANTLASLRNSSAVSFPFGSNVTPLEMRGQGAPFFQAFQYLGQQIAVAMLHQTLSNQQSQYGTKAQAMVHENVLETLIHQFKSQVARMVRMQILRKWVFWNYGALFLTLTPRVNLGDVEEADFGDSASAYAALGYKLDQSQFVGVDRQLGVPERSPNWQAESMQRDQMEAQFKAEAFGAPPPGSGTAPGQQGQPNNVTQQAGTTPQQPDTTSVSYPGSPTVPQQQTPPGYVEGTPGISGSPGTDSQIGQQAQQALSRFGFKLDYRKPPIGREEALRRTGV